MKCIVVCSCLWIKEKQQQSIAPPTEDMRWDGQARKDSRPKGPSSKWSLQPTHTNTITPAHRFISNNHSLASYRPSRVSPSIPLLFVHPCRSSTRCTQSCAGRPVFVFNWMKTWCIMWKERNTRQPKSMSPAAIENNSFLLLTFFHCVFFLLHWNSGSFMFFSCI